MAEQDLSEPHYTTLTEVPYPGPGTAMAYAPGDGYMNADGYGSTDYCATGGGARSAGYEDLGPVVGGGYGDYGSSPGMCGYDDRRAGGGPVRSPSANSADDNPYRWD